MWMPEKGIAYSLVHRDSETFFEEADAGIAITASHTQNRLWLFEANTDGTLIIQNEATGSYLSLEEDGDLCMTPRKDEAASWYAEQMRDGSCRIALAQTGKYLNVTDGSVTLGARADVWELRALTLRLNVYYDAAFADTYAQKGIYAVDALEKILMENSDGIEGWRGAETFFREELHVRLDLHITDTAHQSYPYAAGCLYQDEPLIPCHNCTDAEIDGYGAIEYCQNGYHHKDADHIIRSIPQSDAEFNLLFTGHRATCACEVENDGKTKHVNDKSNIFGRAEDIGKGNRCAVFLGAFTDILNYNQIKHSAVHEICHLLGARHHTADENPCLHGFGELTSGSVASEEAYRYLPICDGCLEKIEKNKANALIGHMG